MQTLQKFLGVKDDGDVGPVTLKAATKFLKSKKMLPHTGVIGGRTDNIYDDKFPDYLFAVINSEVVGIIHATTTPGLKGVFGFEKYNKSGVGVWAEEEIFKDSHIFDTSPNKYGAPMFKQRRDIKVYRDANKDKIINKENIEIAGPEKTFQLHQMGLGFWLKALVGWWSLGCMGAPKDEWTKLTNHFKQGDIISTGVTRLY